MKETEIRQRVNDAFGETAYPPDLSHRIAARLEQSPHGRGHSQIFSLVAALLALIIVGTLVFVRFQTRGVGMVPAVTPPAISSPQPNPMSVANAQLPQLDVDRAELASAAGLVTPFNLTSTNGGHKVTLIGAYADSARTVLFFRTMEGGVPNAQISDDTGFLNASSTGGAGIVGDDFFALDEGPHRGPDGLAHLSVVVDQFPSFGQPSVIASGNWTFAFALNLQGSSALTLSPPLTAVGSWKFTIEAFEVTSTLIHFQAVIDGAAVEDLSDTTIKLSDSTGKSPRNVSWSAGTTVPKSQLTAIPPRNTRVNITWARPAAAGDYVLAISGGGSQYRGTVNIPAPAPSTPTKGQPLTPTDFPSATESLALTGAFSVAITQGNPSQCGEASGPDGIELFAFATWFQVDGAW